MTPEDVDARFAEIAQRERGVALFAHGYAGGRVAARVLVGLLGVAALLGVVGIVGAAWRYLLGG